MSGYGEGPEVSIGQTSVGRAVFGAERDVPFLTNVTDIQSRLRHTARPARGSSPTPAEQAYGGRLPTDSALSWSEPEVLPPEVSELGLGRVPTMEELEFSGWFHAGGALNWGSDAKGAAPMTVKPRPTSAGGYGKRLEPGSRRPESAASSMRRRAWGP